MPPTPPAIQLVCFDIGRVLIQLVYGWEEACALAGVPLPAGIADGSTRAAVLDACDRHEKGWISNEAFCAETAALVGLTPAQVEAVSTVWLRGPSPGAAEVIDAVRAAGKQAACLSNTNAHHWALMHADPAMAALLARLDHRFASHLLGATKPDPAIFAAVEAATGLPPTAILFFDDAPPNVAAARARGWHAQPIAPHCPVAPQLRALLGQYGVL